MGITNYERVGKVLDVKREDLLPFVQHGLAAHSDRER
jgi:hypothetical protein